MTSSHKTETQKALIIQENAIKFHYIKVNNLSKDTIKGEKASHKKEKISVINTHTKKRTHIQNIKRTTTSH